MNVNYLKKIQNAIDYIEFNLKEKLSVKDIAKEACLSMYHFHRIFTAFTGETVGDYIRKRRLTEASYELTRSDKKILDIAFDYRFESQEAFTRSFKRNFKSTPGRYRKEKSEYRFFERRGLSAYSLEHLAKGITTEPVIKKKEAFTVVGLRCTTSIKNNKIPALWGTFVPRIEEIDHMSQPGTALGICEIVSDFKLEDFHEESEYSELVCVEVSKVENLPEGMVSRVIPGATYAVFTHRGTMAALRATYDYIYGVWLIKSGYQIILANDFELYDSRFLGPDNKKSEIDIYIPIIKAP